MQDHARLQTHPMRPPGPGENRGLLKSWEREEAVSGGVPLALPPPPLSSLGVLANRPELKSLTRLIGELFFPPPHHIFFLLVISEVIVKRVSEA